MSASRSERWRPIIAALLDDDARAALAETARTPLTPKRRARALDRLELAGLIRREADAVEFDTDAVRALLASAPQPTGPERFLDGDGRIDRYPATAGDRHDLLVWVAARAFSAGDDLTETEVGTRLEPFAPGGDVAVLRRYLVDHELLERTRSGSAYSLAAAGPDVVDDA